MVAGFQASLRRPRSVRRRVLEGGDLSALLKKRGRPLAVADARIVASRVLTGERVRWRILGLLGIQVTPRDCKAVGDSPPLIQERVSVIDPHVRCQVATGVHNMHKRAGICHASLKPDNIGLLRDGDFRSTVIFDIATWQPLDWRPLPMGCPPKPWPQPATLPILDLTIIEVLPRALAPSSMVLALQPFLHVQHSCSALAWVAWCVMRV